jgi:RNA polymerase sigma-70 factor (ECF subfamily)
LCTDEWGFRVVKSGDHDLVRSVLEGDEEAVGLVIRWISQVLTWPRFWALREERSDLVQESLARVIASLKGYHFDPSKDLHPYVQGIARHTALQAVEAVRRRRGRDGDGPDGSHDSDSSLWASAEPPLAESVAQQELVRRVLDEASDECSLLMRLYFLEGKSYEEIAGELVVPVGTVKSRLSRCLDAAQRSLRVAVHRPHGHRAEPRRRRESSR